MPGYVGPVNFTALHRVLGLPPGPITDEMLDEAVAAGVAETDDLDWKSELPPTSNLPSSDVPKWHVPREPVRSVLES